MNKQDFENRISSLQEKIGDEKSNLILDDIGVLLTDNISMNDTIDKKDKEIEKLTKEKETLQKVNGNLLLQVSMGTEPKKEDSADDTNKDDNKKFDFRSVFDEKGNFKK